MNDLFVLALDHRRSLEKLYGVSATPSSDEVARMVDGKHLVFEALVAARGQRPDLDGVGILVDPTYGGTIPTEAIAAGIQVALSIEKSGQAVFEVEFEDWLERVTEAGPTWAKVLVRYHPDGDAEGNRTQVDRLVEVSRALAGTPTKFLFELIVPFSDADRAAVGDDAIRLENEVRPAHIATVMGVMQDAGVEADCWKIEGVASAEGCARIAAQASAGGRDAGVVVLGAGAPDDVVVAWLRAGAASGYQGFAVGRSIWADTLRAFDTGALDRAGARERVTTQYLAFVDAFLAGRSS
jgi:5-dehydro-2-deoxygluconokinase